MGAVHIWRDGGMVEYVESPPRAGRLQYSTLQDATARSVDEILGPEVWTG